MLPEQSRSSKAQAPQAFDHQDHLKILIVDDHPLFAEGLQLVIEVTRTDTQVLHSKNLAHAEQTLHEHTDIDLVLLDLKLPDGPGLSFLKTLKRKEVYAPCVILSASENPLDIKKSLSAGASGYISKANSGQSILKLIDKVMAGEIVQPATVSNIYSNANHEYLDLTPRQQQILELLAEGLSNKAICQTLGITEHTIKSHIKSLYANLNTHSRTECINVGRAIGLIN